MFLPTINRAYAAVFSGNLLLLVCGTALTWSSPELPKLTDSRTSPFHRTISPSETSWISSVVTLGAAVGPFLFGFAADRIGRKTTLIHLGLPFLICYPLLALSATTEAFLAARFVKGLAVGGAFTVMPMYIGEITSKDNRGALSSSMSCFVCLGILLSCSAGPYLSVTAFNLTLAAFPLLFLVLFSLLAPESPHFHVKMKENEMALSVLARMRPNLEVAERELKEIQAVVEEQESGTMLGGFWSRGVLRAFVMSVGLLVFQQLSGINAVLFYGQQIFQQAGTTLPAEICTIVIVCVQFLSSFLTPLIVDRFGRKIILLASAFGMLASEVPLGVYFYLKNHDVEVDSVSFLPIVTLTTFIVAFNVGFGPLPWALLCELFPSNVKSTASALVSSFIWVMAFLLTKYFEAMVQAFGMDVLFLFFGFCCLMGAFFTAFCVVETKGKTLKEIQDILNS